MSRKLTTITGPTASGKTELIKCLENNYPFSRLISVTTRPMRPGEVDGVDYYFIDRGKFQEYQNNGGLIQEVEFKGQCYGTTVEELERVFAVGDVPIVIVEPSGIPQFKRVSDKYGFELVTVYVTAHPTALKQRFLLREHAAGGMDKTSESGLTDYQFSRLSAIEEESKTWSSAWDYDIVLHNSGSSLDDIDRLASDVNKHVFGS